MSVTKFSRLNLQKEVLADQFRGFFKKNEQCWGFCIERKGEGKKTNGG